MSNNITFPSLNSIDLQDPIWPSTLVLVTDQDPIQLAYDYAQDSTVGYLYYLDNKLTNRNILAYSNLYGPLERYLDEHLMSPQDIIVTPSVSLISSSSNIDRNVNIVSISPENNNWHRILGALYPSDIIIIPLPYHSTQLEEVLKRNMGKFMVVIIVNLNNDLEIEHHMNFGQFPTPSNPPTSPTPPTPPISIDYPINYPITNKSDYPISTIVDGTIILPTLPNLPITTSKLTNIPSINHYSLTLNQLKETIKRGSKVDGESIDVLFPNSNNLSNNAVLIPIVQEAYIALMEYYGLYYDGLRLMIIRPQRFVDNLINDRSHHQYIKQILMTLKDLQLLILYEAFMTIISQIQYEYPTITFNPITNNSITQ